MTVAYRNEKLQRFPNNIPETTVELILSQNQIQLIENVGQLKKLLTLDLQLNLISKLDSLQQNATILNLKFINLRQNQIQDASPLQFLVNLEKLKLGFNKINDLTWVRSNINLKHLEIDGNQVQDLSPISSLLNLQWLDASSNKLDKLPLNIPKSLQVLFIQRNQIVHLNPLSELSNLVTLNCSLNKVQNIDCLFKCQKLTTCWIDRNKIDIVPDFQKILPNVQDLWVKFGVKHQNPFVEKESKLEKQILKDIPMISYNGENAISFEQIDDIIEQYSNSK